MKQYQALASELPKDIFKPYPWRLFSFFLFTSLWIASIMAIVLFPMAWPFKFLLALLIGHCWGMNGLIAHEILHGSVIRNQKLQDIFGFFALLPYMISPTFWRYWHNRLHHSHTQKLIMDPDAYPTYRVFKHSKFTQWMFPFSPGSGYKRSYLYFFFWFSVNVLVAQFYFRFRNKTFDKLNHARVNIELGAQVLLFLGIMIWAGPWNLLWVWFIPFAIQNYSVFSYISTNHNLSPLTKNNDPLVNSLTVTNHPILEFLHLNFGYHVEHHIFPRMSPKRVKPLHELLKKKYPETYQYMPKWKALRALYKTARIYKTPTTLMNPHTGETYPTIGKVVETKKASAPETSDFVKPEPETREARH